MRISSVFMLLFLWGAAVTAQEIAGNWSGTLDITGNKLPLVFRIAATDSVYTTLMDSPAQNATGLPTTRTTFSGNRLEIVATGLGIFFQGTLRGDSIAGTFNQGGMAFPLTLKREDQPSYNRPQTPVGPFPYSTEEVFFENGEEDITLAGTLTLPASGERLHAAAVLVAGSGPLDRDETLLGHKPFWVLADYLARNGIAVLRYDKRGVGKSAGKYPSATLKNLAADVRAALDYLSRRPETAKKPLGLVGHSEGGIVAAKAVSEHAGEVAFLVLLAAPGVGGKEIILEQNRLALKEQNMEPENEARSMEAVAQILQELSSDWVNDVQNREILRDRLAQLWEQFPLLTKMKLKKEVYLRAQLNEMTRPLFREFLALEPEAIYRKISCPVLALNGMKDTQVASGRNLAAIRAALEAGGNRRYEIKEYPPLNHLFQEARTGKADEYGLIEQTFAPETLSDIGAWIKNNTSEPPKPKK